MSTITRRELFEARNVSELFELVTAYLGRKPTVREMRTYTNTVLGPWHIPADVSERCARNTQ